MDKQSKKIAFYVGFGVVLSDDLSDEKFGVIPGLPEESDFKKGSFLIYIEDVATGQRVWRGIAQGFAHNELTPAQ